MDKVYMDVKFKEVIKLQQGNEDSGEFTVHETKRYSKHKQLIYR